MSILDGAFKNITRAEDPVKQGVGGQAYLDNILALQVGHGSTTMKSNQNGLWLGAKKSTDAPFYVDMNGNVVATSINLGGAYIETGGAANDINVGGVKVIGTQIVSLSITSTQISDGAISTPKLQANAVTANEIAANAITAGKIAANAIEADKIAANAITSVKILAGAITSDKIFVSALSAISADLGAITAGTISGVTITSTAAAGGRIVLDSGNYLRFYGGGAERSRLRGVNAGGAVGIIDEIGSFAVTREQGFIAASNTSNTDFFKFFCNASAQGIIQLPNSNVFRMVSSDGVTNEITYSESNGFFSNRKGLFNAQLSVNGAISCKEILLNYSQNEGNIRNLDMLIGYNDLRLGTGDGGGSPSGKVKMQNTNLDMNEFTIDACQTVWAYNFNNRSDRRLKENIVPLTSSIDKVLKLKPSTYNFKKLPGENRFGLIAQDVQKIFPDMVHTDDTGMLSIDYISLIPMLIKSVQELYTMIERKK